MKKYIGVTWMRNAEIGKVGNIMKRPSSSSGLIRAKKIKILNQVRILKVHMTEA